MDKTCPYCESRRLIKNGSSYGIAKWRCKDCGRQTSFKPPRGEPAWKKDTAVLLYALGLSMNAIAQQLGVSTPVDPELDPGSRRDARPAPSPAAGRGGGRDGSGRTVALPEKKSTNSGSGWRLIALADASWTGNAAIVMPPH